MDRRRVRPSATRMPPILEHGEPELDLGIGQRLGCRRSLGKRRQVEGRHLQPPVFGLADLAQRLRGSGGEAILAGPDGLAGVLGIERDKPRTVVPVAAAGIGGRCRQSLTHQRHDRIDLARGLGGFRRSGGHSGRGRRRRVDLRRRERVGARRGTRIEIDATRRRCRRGLAPCLSGKAAQHQHGKRDCRKWPADHLTPLAALRGRNTTQFRRHGSRSPPLCASTFAWVHAPLWQSCHAGPVCGSAARLAQGESPRGNCRNCKFYGPT